MKTNSITKPLKKLAIASTLALGVSSSAMAGNILITGHDTDDHDASNYMNWGLTYLMTGNGTTVPLAPTAKIGYIGNYSANLSTYLGNYDNYSFYDLDNASWTNAFSDGNDVLVIGSGYDFINNTGSATMNAAASQFATYFNAGGNLFVNTEQGLGSTFYGFIPGFGATTNAPLPGCSSGAPACMQATAAGAAVGMTDALINEAYITHTRFPTLAPSFTALEFYNNNGTGPFDAITIGLIGGSINNGGFTGGTQVSEPATLGLMGLGFAALGFARRRKSA